jgi:hypothetical protein
MEREGIEGERERERQKEREEEGLFLTPPPYLGFLHCRLAHSLCGPQQRAERRCGKRGGETPSRPDGSRNRITSV